MQIFHPENHQGDSLGEDEDISDDNSTLNESIKRTMCKSRFEEVAKILLSIFDRDDNGIISAKDFFFMKSKLLKIATSIRVFSLSMLRNKVRCMLPPLLDIAMNVKSQLIGGAEDDLLEVDILYLAGLVVTGDDPQDIIQNLLRDFWAEHSKLEEFNQSGELKVLRGEKADVDVAMDCMVTFRLI